MLRAALIGAAALLALPAPARDPSADPILKDGAPVDPRRPLAQELTASAAPGFTVTMVGSLLLDSPSAVPPAFDAAVRKVLAAGGQNLTVGVLEGPLADIPSLTAYPYPWDSAPAVRAATGTALSLKNQGFSAVMQATGHALDWGVEGMRATAAALDQAGLARAGTGNSLGLAAQAGYADDPAGGGRIALVSAATTFRPTSNALAPHGAAPGRPGVSGIELAPVRLVSPSQFRALQRIAYRFKYPGDAAPCADPAPADTVTALGSTFRPGADASQYGTTDYEMNPADAALVLDAIREGKQNADLLVAAFHAGQIDDGRAADPPVPAFLGRLAHAAVESGADMVFVTGRPELGPIELYRSPGGRIFPIFYGLGYFAWSPGLAPPASVTARHDGAIVRSSVSGTRGAIEIIPLALAEGWPRLADAARARAILRRLQTLSARYGTRITITAGITGRIDYDLTGETP